VVALPLVLPPTVLGFYILVAIGPHSPIGRLYTDLVGHPLPFTFEGLLIASVLYSLPFAVQPFAAAFDQVDRKLIEAAWTLGVSRAGTFFKLILPMSVAGVVTGFVLSFAHTLGEFGVVLMVGGNIEGVTRTVSIDIYDEVQALNYAGAAKTSLLLLAVSYLILLSVYAMNRKVWAVWPQK
jgi:molybdate transport system permease protein